MPKGVSAFKKGFQPGGQDKVVAPSGQEQYIAQRGPEGGNEILKPSGFFVVSFASRCPFGARAKRDAKPNRRGAKQGLPHRGNNVASLLSALCPSGVTKKPIDPEGPGGGAYIAIYRESSPGFFVYLRSIGCCPEGATANDLLLPRRGNALAMLSPEGRRSAYCTFRCWSK